MASGRCGAKPDPFTASSGSNSKAVYCDPMGRAWRIQYEPCLVLGSYGTTYYAAPVTLLTEGLCRETSDQVQRIRVRVCPVVGATCYPLKTKDNIERGRITLVLASTVSTIEAVIPYFILAGVIGFIATRFIVSLLESRKRDR